jgi:two-component system cell cycle response regulator DivK
VLTGLPIVVIIDDDLDHLEVLYHLLRDHYDVIRCERAERAVPTIRASSPHLVIMDIRFQEIDGTELLREIRADEQLKHLPVIALTAYAEPGDRDRYLAAGFNEHIRKPLVDVDPLIESIRRLL